MRAARTPPEPPPITNRSVSKSLIAERRGRVAGSEVVALFLHLGAEAIHHLLAEPRRELLLNKAERFFEHLRLGSEHFLANRRFEECHQVLQLRLAEASRIAVRSLRDDFIAPHRKFSAQLRRDVVQVLG